jgi:DNA-directed RNA polymerase specialized sigma24 family protein
MRNWEEYRGIIFGLAFKFSPNSQETEDLIGEGFVCFMEVIEEEKKYGLVCPFEAALSTRIKQHFLNKCKERKQQKRTGEMIPYTEMENDPKVSRNPWEMIEDYISLTGEMREVVDVILNAPNELLDLIRRENFKVGLSKYLKKHKGWTTKELNHFWGEIKIKEGGKLI